MQVYPVIRTGIASTNSRHAIKVIHHKLPLAAFVSSWLSSSSARYFSASKAAMQPVPVSESELALNNRAHLHGQTTA